jgi:hypothetical protein
MMPYLCAMALVTVAALHDPVPETSRTIDGAVILDDYGPCGPISLYLASQMRGVPVKWEQVKDLVGPAGPEETHSFADLSRAATQLGMFPVALEVTREELPRLPMPAIVQVREPKDPRIPPHFLVLLRPEADGVRLLDAPYPGYLLPQAQFQKAWTGNILVFARDAQEADQIRTRFQGPWAIKWGLWACALGGALVFGTVALGRLQGRWQRIGALRSKSVASLWPRQLVGRVSPKMAIATSGALSICLMAGALFAYQRFNPKSARPPRCGFEQSVMELGELAVGQIPVQVPVQNDGELPLRIESVDSSCTCAVVKSPKVIEPGQAALLRVQLNVGPGPRGARLTVASNDPEGPKTLLLSWHGKSSPLLVPSYIAPESAPADRPYERVVRLIYPGGKSAIVPHLKRVECDSPRVTIREGMNDPEQTRFATRGQVKNSLGELALHVRITPPAAPEIFQAKANLVVSYGNTPTTLSLVFAIPFIGGELTPDVQTVTFSASTLEDLKGQERLVRVTQREPERDLQVLDTPPWLNAEVVSREGKPVTIRLKLAQIPHEGLTQHTIRIARANDPTSELRLPVNVFAPRQ